MSAESFNLFIDRAVEAVREKRISLGINQKELSEKIGKAQSHIARFESGSVRDPRISMFFLICEALQVNPAEILGSAYGDPKKIGKETSGNSLKSRKISKEIGVIDKLAAQQWK